MNYSIIYYRYYVSHIFKSFFVSSFHYQISPSCFLEDIDSIFQIPRNRRFFMVFWCLSFPILTFWISKVKVAKFHSSQHHNSKVSFQSFKFPNFNFPQFQKNKFQKSKLLVRTCSNVFKTWDPHICKKYISGMTWYFIVFYKTFLHERRDPKSNIW